MKELEKLLLLMKSLRDPVNGCPWDKEQTIDSIKAFTLEEAYEVVDAIERNDIQGLRDELGDLLFHIVFYSEMADESEYFNFHDVVKQLNQKLERRHPHVFSDHQAKTIEAVKILWEQIKQQERAVFPVCLSPIINSRCPLPTGTRLSIDFKPVCIGSLTDCLGIIPHLSVLWQIGVCNYKN